MLVLVVVGLEPAAVLLLGLLGLRLLAHEVVAERVDHQGVGVQVHLVAGASDRVGNLFVSYKYRIS